MMIETGREERCEWFKKGVDKEQRYMMIVYGRLRGELDNSDFPIYAAGAESVLSALSTYSDEYCTVTEIYDLAADMEPQLSKQPAWNVISEILEAKWQTATAGIIGRKPESLGCNDD